jgi:hypothetical protein
MRASLGLADRIARELRDGRKSYGKETGTNREFIPPAAPSLLHYARARLAVELHVVLVRQQ